MHGNTGDETPPSGSLMPPALTQRDGDRPDARTDARMAPPFVGGPAGSTAPTPVEAPAPYVAVAPKRDEETMPWESMSDEGVVEPMFEADTDAVMAELSKQAKKEEFPMDAFIIPEQAHRVPTGLEGKAQPTQQTNTPLSNLADRLEKLSHRLRVEETDVVVRRLASGDKLDALLAGLLAGYLAGNG